MIYLAATAFGTGIDGTEDVEVYAMSGHALGSMKDAVEGGAATLVVAVGIVDVTRPV